MKRFLLAIAAAGIVLSAGAITRIDFQPLAPVRLVKPSGMVTGYGFGASSDAARGAAIIAAQTAAASGDTIEVWADSEIATDTSIGKNGVRYWFGPVTMTKTTGTAGLLSDGGSAMTFAVEGSGRFVTTVTCSPVKITASGTTFALAGRSCESQSTGGSDIASIQVTGGTTTISLTEYSKSANYDAYWTGIGTHEIHCPLLYGDDNGVECTTIPGSGSTRVYASRIVSVTDDALQILLAGSYRCYIKADSIEAPLLAANSPCSGSARVVIECPRMIGGVSGGNTEIIGATIDATGDANPCVTSSSTGNILADCKLIAESGQDAISGSATTVRGGLETTANISATITYASKIGDSVKLAGTTPTAAGLTLLDDATATAQRTTLGVGTSDAPTFAGLTANGNVSVGGNIATTAGANRQFTVERSGTSDFARFMFYTNAAEKWALGIRGDNGGSGISHTLTLTGNDVDGYPAILNVVPGGSNYVAYWFGATTSNAPHWENANGACVYNEQGNAQNFRVESDTNANMMFVDGTNNRVGVGTGSPGTTLDVSGTVTATAVVGNVFVRDAATGEAQNTPADATTYFWGQPNGFTTWAVTAGKRKLLVPSNCTLTKAYVTFYQTAGSTETSTVSVRVNDTTDNTISASVVNNAAETSASNSSMSVTLSAGDFIEIKWVTPTWTTNPIALSAVTALEFKTR